MSRVRRAGTKPELIVAASLRGAGHSYRKDVKSLPGRPDFANKLRRWAIFVNGCFWHHHTNCKRATVPATNSAFWTDKFRRNRLRDAAAVLALRRQGWRVGIVWECDLRDDAELDRRLRQILEPRGVDVGEPLDH